MRFDLTDTPALTLLNPWPVAITSDIPDPKRVENRSWSAPESVDRFLIHAGKGNDANGYDILEEYGIDLPEVLPVGAIVALADLAHMCDRSVWGNACGCGRWAARGQYHWRLGRVWVLPEPVKCRGFQKLWLPEPGVRLAIEEQLLAVTA